MARVFLSYDRDDTDRARLVALALEKAGHSVWWDLHIRGGEQYTKVIDEALKAADAVVVLWSKYSVESAWVRDEAAAGRDSGRLVPVSLDATEPPLGFRQFQTIDLSMWKGRGKPAQLRTLLGDVEATARTTPASETAAIPAPVARPVAKPGRTFPWPKLAAVAVALLLLAGLGWKFLWQSPETPSVAVESSDKTAASQSLAHDLLVKLGSLQTSNADAVKLVGTGTGTEPSLIFEVGGDAATAQPHASLVLLNGKDRSLFWSKEFSAPAGHGADLRQQLGFTAARIVGCALQALTAKRVRLRQEIVKLYLNACAAFAETSGTGSESVVPMFRQVTKDAPSFDGGWRGLLLSEIELYQGSYSDEVRRQLERDIVAARKVNPNLIEIIQAEIDLSPFNAYSRRMGLAEKAVAIDPNNPLAYAGRAGVLMNIGQMDAAVLDAQKAVQLDSLSPPLRDYYIQTLLYAGRTDAALQEFTKAQQLWPGASNLEFLRFRINLRSGNARDALRTILTDPSTGWMNARSYLEARIDPSPAMVQRAIDDTFHTYQRVPQTIGHLVQVYGEFGRNKELLDLLLKAPQADVIGVTDVMFRPAMEGFWTDPRSLQIAKRVGLLQFWQASGKWPDFCLNHDLPYDCKKEAARLLT